MILLQVDALKQLRGYKNKWFNAEMFPKLIQIDMNKNKTIPTNMTNTSSTHHHLLALNNIHLIPNLYNCPTITALALYIFKQIKFCKKFFSWEYVTVLTS